MNFVPTSLLFRLPVAISLAIMLFVGSIVGFALAIGNFGLLGFLLYLPAVSVGISYASYGLLKFVGFAYDPDSYLTDWGLGHYTTNSQFHIIKDASRE